MHVDIHEFLKQGVIFSLDSESLLVGWGKKTWSKNPPISNGNPWFYFPDFFLSEKVSGFTIETTAVVSIKDFEESLHTVQQTPVSPLLWNSPNKEKFIESFFQLNRSFKKNEIKKIVPYALSTAETGITEKHRLHIFKSLLHYLKQNSAYLYGFWNGEEGMLGATPELLFRYQEIPVPTLETMALAGTVSNKVSNKEFLNDQKLLHEHQIVVDDICRSMHQFNEAQVGEMQILKLWNLSHLHTPIKVSLKGPHQFIEFVKALHPTSSLGGYPKNRALELLEELNKQMPRGRFGAPAGYLIDQKKEAVCYVAIRNIMWNRHQATIAAGCGIVSESSPEKEWEEILLKIDSIHRFMQL